MTAERPPVTVCIVTRNRKDEVLRAVESCLAQDYPSLEVRVYDNASTDGTTDAIRAAFPSVDLTCSDENLGASAQRNACFRECGGKYVVSIDDDGYFTTRDTVSAAVDFMQRREDVAVLAMSFVEPAERGMGKWSPPEPDDGNGVLVRSFVACACTFRKEPVLEVEGYRTFFKQWGEERDLSIRLMNRGHRIVYADTPRIVHTGSAKRDEPEFLELGIRNTLLFDWLNIPCPFALPRLVTDAVRLLFHKAAPKNFFSRLRFVARAATGTMRHTAQRDAVRRETYKQYRSLTGHGPIDIVRDLPPPVGGATE